MNAEHIIVFPNNKNILLAATQAAKIYKDSDVIVIPTKTIAEGLSALTMLDTNDEPEELVENLKEVISNVTSVAVTYAIRDTTVDDVKIQKGDYIGIMNGKIVTSHKRRRDTMVDILKQANLNEKDIVTIIYGADVNEKQASEFSKFITKNYSHLEIELIEGNQEVYSYILAIE